MRHISWIAICTFVSSPLVAQPPAPLPSTIVPAAASSPVNPLARFAEITKYPAKTLAVVDSYRSATQWLGKMHQAHGRFLPGINPSLASKIDGDSDARQAVACLALCQAARMNPDPATTAKANQAVLALFAAKKTREDGSAAEKVVYAAALSLAVRELPTADPKLMAAAEQLVSFLKSAAAPDGTFPSNAAMSCSGLAVQAVAASIHSSPAAWKAELLVKAAAGYRAAFKVKPNAIEASSVLAGLADGYFATKNPAIASAAFELTNAICAAQYSSGDTKTPAGWVGGFRGPTEPGYEVAIVARGLAEATRLTRQASTDLARYSKYRQATLGALAFVESLQYTDDTTSHFDSKFRTQFLIGGVRVGASNGVIRADSTAWAALAFAAFLDSGAEGRE
ncbi:MAG TPA: hypothetical protein VGJ05_20490 [Fimbriiglobus sp.]|jgi:hypothetical protein